MSEEKKKLDPVIDGKNVVVRKKSKGQRAVESFLGEEVESVKDHIVQDLIIPSTKDALSNMCGSVVDFFNDMFHDFINSIFFGSAGPTKTKSSDTYVSYQGYYSSKNKQNSSYRRESSIKERHNISELDYTYEDAIKVRNELLDLDSKYPYITVAELFDLSNQTLDWVEYKEKEKYGWTDLSNLGYPRSRRGRWIIPLPRPERLEVN